MKLKFESKLERLAEEIEYYHVLVPPKITAALKTKAAVPILYRLNGAPAIRGSLYVRGEGRHGMRVKAEARKAAGLKEGSRVRVEITVVDRKAEAADLPRDLEKALRADGVLQYFKALPPGQTGFMLRKIEQAAKPETRAKRIQEAVMAAHAKKEKLK